jgi:hypothetical protein
LNICRVSDVRQIKIQTAQPLVPIPRPFEFEIAVAKLKRYKLQGSDEIPAELIQARSEIYKLINFIWNKEELPDHWKESITVLVHKMGDKIGCSNYHGISSSTSSSWALQPWVGLRLLQESLPLVSSSGDHLPSPTSYSCSFLFNLLLPF